MHICLDFIPELLAQPELEKQVGQDARFVTSGNSKNIVCGHNLCFDATVLCRRDDVTFIRAVCTS